MITKNMETNINRNMRLKSMVLKNKIKRLSNDKINFSLQPILQPQQPSLMLMSHCNCKVCIHIPNINKQSQQIPNKTSPNIHHYMNTLLQHLTMIQPQKTPLLLGQILIPMLFFKIKSKDKNIYNKNIIYLNKNLFQNFILFQNNHKNGQLLPPIYVKSIKKVSELMRKAHDKPINNKKQLIKQWQKNQQNSNIIYPLSCQKQKIFHNVLFNQIIPSYSFHKIQKISSKLIHKYIVHSDNFYCPQQQQYYKQRALQPFCLFRYQDNNNNKISQYQTFTMQTLQLYQKNKQIKLNNNTHTSTHLNLICIQSYIRTKMTASPLHSSHSNLQLVYFSQYNINNPPTHATSPIWSLVQLETNLRLKKISLVDPSYLNRADLQLLIQNTLGLNQQISTQQIQRIIQYKTYKIITTLKNICLIEVLGIKLKWIINQNDDIIMIQCLQYTINPNIYSYIHQKINNYYRIVCGVYQDDGKFNQINQSLINQQTIDLYRQFLSQRKSTNQSTSQIRSQTQQKQIQTQQKKIIKILQMANKQKDIKQSNPRTKQKKSISLVPIHKKLVSQSRLLYSLPHRFDKSNKISNIISKHYTLNRIDSQEKIYQHQRYKMSKEQINIKYRCRLRKSFKLKPFKTETSTEG